MSNTFHFTEDSYEQSIISLFKEMGYEYHYGPELEADTNRELTDATIPGALRKAMLLINGTDKLEPLTKLSDKYMNCLVSPWLVQTLPLLTGYRMVWTLRSRPTMGHYAVTISK